MRRTSILIALCIIAASGCSKNERTSTAADTQPDTEEQTSAKPDRSPNFIVVLLDDTGYADFGAYGSEINTPNIDQLAENGVQFSNYHTPATCSPTRSMLFRRSTNEINS